MRALRSGRSSVSRKQPEHCSGKNCLNLKERPAFHSYEERGVSFRLTTIHLSLLSAAFTLGRISGARKPARPFLNTRLQSSSVTIFPREEGAKP